MPSRHPKYRLNDADRQLRIALTNYRRRRQVTTIDTLAEYNRRAAAGLEAVQHAPALRAWLAGYDAFVPVIDLAPFDITPLHFEGEPAEGYATLEDFTARINAKLAAADATLGYGGYLEQRPFYSSALFDAQAERSRSLHLGIDLWCPAGTPVRAPLDGTIHSFANNDRGRDYGGTVILEHHVDGHRFWSLYGHLGLAKLGHLRERQHISAGTAFAKTGAPDENGGWPPHLHLQVITDMLDYRGDFPGVAYPDERRLWSSLVLDASALAGVPYG